jgi:hypothetical protein
MGAPQFCVSSCCHGTNRWARPSMPLMGGKRFFCLLRYTPTMSAIVFPREGQGFRAELTIGDDYHLLLMATHTAVGPVMAIYDVKANNNKWWRERQWAEDIDDAKAKAEATVRAYYRVLHLRDPFPALEWKET